MIRIFYVPSQRKTAQNSMNFRQIEAFVVVARLGSFAAAADFLSLTQPAISTRLSNLESRIGTQLFDRSRRAVRLTAKGYELLPHATRIIDDAQIFRRRADISQFLSNRIRVGATDSFVRTSLTPIMVRFFDAHPEISVDLTVGDSTILWSQLMNGETDVVFAVDPMIHSSIRSQPLYSDSLIWTASSKNFASDTILSLEDVTDKRFFLSRQGSGTYSLVCRALAEQMVSDKMICGIASMEAALRLTEGGFGIGVFMGKVAADPIKAGNLVKISIPSVALPTLNYHVTHRTDSLSDAGRILADCAFRVISGTDFI